MSQTQTSPVALAAALEANGPGACLSRRAWNVLAALMRVVDPVTADVDISHQDLALRTAHRSTRTVSRALGELVAAGLIDHTPGGRVGHGSTDVRVSRMRVWTEVVETLLDEGRELVRLAREEAWAITQARMRVLLDWRARRRTRREAVDSLAGLLDLALEPQTRRSAVMDRKSMSPPGPGPGPGGARAPDPYIQATCPHDGIVGRCPSCRRSGIGSADAQTRTGGA